MSQFLSTRSWTDKLHVFVIKIDVCFFIVYGNYLFQGVLEDIKTLQHNVKSINTIAKAFMEESDADFKVSLCLRMCCLREREREREGGGGMCVCVSLCV